jgi:hypothetical protein
MVVETASAQPCSPANAVGIPIIVSTPSVETASTKMRMCPNALGRHDVLTKQTVETESAKACRRANAIDKPAVVSTLSDAFFNEPAFSFIVPDAAARKRALEKAFRIIVDEDHKIGSIMMTSGAEAATAWRTPGLVRDSQWDAIRTGLPYLLAFGTAIGRASLVAKLIKSHLPVGEYWYLHYAGCHSSHRSIRAGLEQADAARCKAYLETADENNIPIYRALGFHIMHSWQVPDGPQFWGMMRGPR